jgi:hypothetical protein
MRDLERVLNRLTGLQAKHGGVFTSKLIRGRGLKQGFGCE